MEIITISGHLTRDAETVSTQNGVKFITFTVAVNSRRKNNEVKTHYYDAMVFDSRMVESKFAEFLKKGSSVLVSGELDASIEEGKNGNHYLRLKVNAKTVEFANSSSGSTATNAEQTTNSQPAAKKAEAPQDIKSEPQQPEAAPVNEDELPF